MYAYVLRPKRNTLENFHEAPCSPRFSPIVTPFVLNRERASILRVIQPTVMCLMYMHARPIQRILIATATKSRFKNVCAITADTSIYLPTLACEMIQIISILVHFPSVNKRIRIRLQILKLLVTFLFFSFIFFFRKNYRFSNNQRRRMEIFQLSFPTIKRNRICKVARDAPIAKSRIGEKSTTSVRARFDI